MSLGRAVQRSGTTAATPILSGLHHRYARVVIFGNDSCCRVAIRVAMRPSSEADKSRIRAYINLSEWISTCSIRGFRGIQAELQ